MTVRLISERQIKEEKQSFGDLDFNLKILKRDREK
jgi:hypothetical protein